MKTADFKLTLLYMVGGYSQGGGEPVSKGEGANACPPLNETLLMLRSSCMVMYLTRLHETEQILMEGRVGSLPRLQDS